MGLVPRLLSFKHLVQDLHQEEKVFKRIERVLDPEFIEHHDNPMVGRAPVVRHAGDGPV